MERELNVIEVRRVCEILAVETRGDKRLERMAGERIRSFAFVLRGIVEREARRGAPRVR